jgi:hypothetical protein
MIFVCSERGLFARGWRDVPLAYQLAVEVRDAKWKSPLDRIKIKIKTMRRGVSDLTFFYLGILVNTVSKCAANLRLKLKQLDINGLDREELMRRLEVLESGQARWAAANDCDFHLGI